MAGGYRLKPRTRRIVFDDDTEFPGLELEAHGLTVGEWQDQMARWPDVFEMFGERLISWNLEVGEGRKATKVPPSMDGFKLVEVDALKAIILEWVDACTGVYRSGPLDPDPSSGGPNADELDQEMEASIPMNGAATSEPAATVG